MASTYDQAANPLVALEQRVVRSILEACVPAIVLHAGYGTGRHSEYLLPR